MDYWQRRAIKAQQNRQKKTEKELEEQLAKYYKKAMEQTIADFEATYDKLQAAMDAGKEPTPADLYKLDKYWQMQAQLQKNLENLGDMSTKSLQWCFETQYEDIYKAIALPSNKAFSTIDTDVAKQAVNRIWCADGKSWSQRVWTNTAKLQQTLNDELINCIVTGKKTSDLKKKLIERFNVSYHEASTLVRTETAHIQTAAAEQRYKDYGITEYEVWADKDERRCDECGKLHKKRYKMGEKIPVPVHPNCRCCIIPVIDGYTTPEPEPKPEPKPQPKPQPKPAPKPTTPKATKATTPKKKATPAKVSGEDAIIKQEGDYFNATKELQELDMLIRETKRRKLFVFTSDRADKIEAELADLNNQRDSLMAKRQSLAKGIDTLRPHKVAGVNVDKPMTFEAADGARANPHYNDGYEYKVNCQTCVVSYEARRRGYDVMATGNKKNGGANQQVAYNTSLAWVDPATGKQPSYIVPQARTAKGVQSWCESNLAEDGRYTIEFCWRNYRAGHIVSIHKQNGELMIYDPQTSKIYKGDDITALLQQTKVNSIQMLRVDTLEFNPVYVNDLLKARDK